MRPLRVGLIGAGGVAGVHLLAFARFPELLQLAAVCDVNEESAQRRATEAGIDAVYSDPFEMLRDADLDAVDICTVHDQHAPLAIAAAESGRHILVEKPMACSLNECKSMIDAADCAGVTLMAAQSHRFMTVHQAAKAMIDSGELGVIRSLRFDFQQAYRAFPEGHWLFDGGRAGGGVVISSSVHQIDLMRYLVGETTSVWASCRSGEPRFVNGAEDSAAATLNYSNGAVGALFATASLYHPRFFQQFMIFGEEGTLKGTIGPDNVGVVEIASSVRSSVSIRDARFVPLETVDPSDTLEGIVGAVTHFAECCRDGTEPASSGRDNLETMKVIFAIYESARTGKPIEIRDL